MDVKSALMQPDLVRQFVEALFNEQLATNWRFYLLVGGVTLLANIFWVFATPYIKKRSETLATKADLDELLRQVEKTTRVTEEVRASVSQMEWVSREWRTLRRIKLEELLTAAYRHDFWLQKLRDKFIYDKDVDEVPEPYSQMQLLMSLYFPELEQEVLKVKLAHINLQKLIINGSEDLKAAKATRSPNTFEAVQRDFVAQHDQLYSIAHNAILDLEMRAGKVMADFASV